jgi:hypothetical protein
MTLTITHKKSKYFCFIKNFIIITDIKKGFGWEFMYNFPKYFFQLIIEWFLFVSLAFPTSASTSASVFFSATPKQQKKLSIVCV